MKKHKPQAQKPRNEAWMRARLEHANRNNTVPDKRKVYKRKPKHGGWK